MKKITRVVLIGLLILTFTSCGTIMTRKTELVTVNSNVDTKVKLYLNYQPIGDAKATYVASTGWRKDILMAENVNTGQKLVVPLDYGFNGWFIGSIFLPFGVIVDLITGSVTDLGETNYYMNFDKDLENKEKN